MGHFDHPLSRPWVEYPDKLTPLMAEVVGKSDSISTEIPIPLVFSPDNEIYPISALGAKEKEVAVMATLTSNLHLMMDSFYKPTPERYKILCEAKAFPSDQVSPLDDVNKNARSTHFDLIQYAFTSQALAHGLDPAKAILELSPREGEYTLREEDIIQILEEQGPSIALVLFSGVQYYTGQWFPMESVTKKAKEQASSTHFPVTSVRLSFLRLNVGACSLVPSRSFHVVSTCINSLSFSLRVAYVAGISLTQPETFRFVCTTGTLILLYGVPINI
jgi:kynureninase